MKRAVLLCFLFLVLCSSLIAGNSVQEFKFMNIPFTSDINTVRTALRDVGLDDPYISDPGLWHEWGTDIQRFVSSSKYGRDMKYYPSSDFMIAGHSVSRIDLAFLYGIPGGKIDYSDENTELVQVAINFITSDAKLLYDDLNEKLSSLYGKGKSVEDISWYESYNTYWVGDKNTGIDLACGIRKENNAVVYQSVILYYGRIDNETMLRNVLKAIEADNNEKNKSNTWGL